jgi:hypothetical protein
MINYKKIDDQDFIFVNEPPSAKEDKEFSEYLKNRKLKPKVKRNLRVSADPKIELR